MYACGKNIRFRITREQLNQTVLSGYLHLKVKMIVVVAFWIECGTAVWALIITVEVLVNGHFLFTNTAENGILVKFPLCPPHGRMPGFFRVTIKTGIIGVAAFKFYRDNIQGRIVMNTARLVVGGFAFEVHSGGKCIQVTSLFPWSHFYSYQSVEAHPLSPVTLNLFYLK
jgi:hypothetical protein